MQANFYEVNTCLGCKKLYNFEERKPLELPCEDMICQQCYKSQTEKVKKNQNKKQQIKCPYDNTHLCAIDEPVSENKYLIRNLQKQNFYLINCSEHLDIQALVYCKLRNKIICSICMIVDPHLNCLQDIKTHFAFDRKLLENAFQKVLPYFYDEIEQMKNLINNVNAFVYKERQFSVEEIEKIINKSCQILQLSPINDDVKIKLRENTDILNFITNFTDNAFQQINHINNEGQLQVLVPSQEDIKAINIQNQLQELQDTVNELSQTKIENLANQFNQLQTKLDYNSTFLKTIKPEIEQCIIFRRLVDFQLDVKQQPKLFKINGICKLIYKASRDGFKAINFHQKCDNQGPTISFIQSEHGEVFGGYTSISWTSPDQWQKPYKDNDAFVFSLTKNTLLKQYQNFDQAVYHRKDQLIEFGDDISIKNDCNQNQSSSSSVGFTYRPSKCFKNGDFSKDYLAGSFYFKVIEIEVYSVKI